MFLLTFFWVLFLLLAGAAGHILSALAAAGTWFFLSWRCHVVVYVVRRQLCVFDNWNTHMWFCDSGRVVNVSADLVFPQFWGEETGGFLARHMFRASMYAADIDALTVHGESAVSQAPASPQASIQTAEPDTPVASYMHILENSGPPSPLQIGRFGDSPATQRYKRWGIKALCHFLSQRFSKFLQMRRSWCIPFGPFFASCWCGSFRRHAWKYLWKSIFRSFAISGSWCSSISLAHASRPYSIIWTWSETSTSGTWNYHSVFAGMSRMPLLLAQSSRPNLRLNLDKITKWGRCPTCRHCLRPHHLRSGGRKGQLILYRSRWWQKGSINGRQCWGSRPFDLTPLQELDLRLRQKYNSVENGLCRNAR